MAKRGKGGRLAALDLSAALDRAAYERRLLHLVCIRPLRRLAHQRGNRTHVRRLRTEKVSPLLDLLILHIPEALEQIHPLTARQTDRFRNLHRLTIGRQLPLIARLPRLRSMRDRLPEAGAIRPQH